MLLLSSLNLGCYRQVKITLMSKPKKNYLIPEERFKQDFAPLSGFYDYHVKGKNIAVALNEIQGFGVSLDPKKRGKIANVNSDSLEVNSIYFSSSKKKDNVKNLMWTIRCLVAHPENISEKIVNDVKCYSINCGTKDKKTGNVIPTMKGLVSCEVWQQFTKQLCNKIIEKEK